MNHSPDIRHDAAGDLAYQKRSHDDYGVVCSPQAIASLYKQPTCGLLRNTRFNPSLVYTENSLVKIT